MKLLSINEILFYLSLEFYIKFGGFEGVSRYGGIISILFSPYIKEELVHSQKFFLKKSNLFEKPFFR